MGQQIKQNTLLPKVLAPLGRLSCNCKLSLLAGSRFGEICIQEVSWGGSGSHTGAGQLWCSVRCAPWGPPPQPGSWPPAELSQAGAVPGDRTCPERGLASGSIRTGLGCELPTTGSALPGGREAPSWRGGADGRHSEAPTCWSSPSPGRPPKAGRWMLNCQTQWEEIIPDDGRERIRALLRYLTGMLKETWIKSWSVQPLPRKTLINMAEWYS